MNNIVIRAKLYRQIRHFFQERNVLEIETPLLYSSSATDPYIKSFTIQRSNKTLYLQTSPELCMKRLLCAGSGDIYQICKAFRDDEISPKHNSEFTLLEWYRIGFNHHQLMEEVDTLLQRILHTQPADRISYERLFINNLSIHPHIATLGALQSCAKKNNLDLPDTIDKDDCLNLLLTHLIEPTLAHQRPLFIYDYPPSQAALATIRKDSPPVAERFELYYKGLELANGYRELTNGRELRQRFERDNCKRRQVGLPSIPPDEPLLQAIKKGMPACAGVALGIDRLLMRMIGTEAIQKIIHYSACE